MDLQSSQATAMESSSVEGTSRLCVLPNLKHACPTDFAVIPLASYIYMTFISTCGSSWVWTALCAGMLCYLWPTFGLGRYGNYELAFLVLTSVVYLLLLAVQLVRLPSLHNCRVSAPCSQWASQSMDQC